MKTATQAVTEQRSRTVPLMNPRLRERMAFYKIDPPPTAPVFDRIFVYPLKPKEEEKTAGGLVVPDQAKQVYESAHGLLVAAGPKAVEQLYSHGIGLGDLVVVARLSMWNRRYFVKGREHSVMVLRASEVVSSDDLYDAYERGDMWMEMAPDGSVSINDREHGSRDRIDVEESNEGI